MTHSGVFNPYAVSTVQFPTEAKSYYIYFQVSACTVRPTLNAEGFHASSSDTHTPHGTRKAYFNTLNYMNK